MRTVLACVAVIGGAFTLAPISIERARPSVERGVHRRYAAVAFDSFVLFNPDSVVSAVDRVAPLGVDRLKLDKRDIVFAAFGAWDAAGAKSFGYPTVWVNRFNQPREELGVDPDRTVSDLNGVLDFVLNPER